MKKNKLLLITIVLIVFLLIIVLLIRMNTSIDFKVNKFKHINISEMKTGKGKAHYDDYSYIYYEDKKGTPSEGGKKYGVVLKYPDKEIFIEENILSHDGFEEQGVESILYSESRITKDIANNFIHSIHNETPSCGLNLNKFKKIQKNYYYIKFEILGEC